MTIKGLREKIRTLKDWELQEIRMIIGNDELTKHHMITMELQRRKKARETGTYVDETLEPSTPLRKRVS